MTLAMHWLTLWATGEILGCRVKTCQATCCINYSRTHRRSHHNIAASLDIFVHMLQSHWQSFQYCLQSRISFGPLPLSKFILVSGHVLGISILAFGGASSTAYLTGRRLIPTLFGLLGTVLITTEIGWGYVRRRFREWLLYVPIEIHFGDIWFQVNALIDTGNRLKDPLTGSPVILLEYNNSSKVSSRGSQAGVHGFRRR